MENVRMAKAGHPFEAPANNGRCTTCGKMLRRSKCAYDVRVDTRPPQTLCRTCWKTFAAEYRNSTRNVVWRKWAWCFTFRAGSWGLPRGGYLNRDIALIGSK